MRPKHIRKLTRAALIGAAYAVLSLLGSIFGITYGPIQCRFAEALCVLPVLFPETVWGLAVGCLLSNILSPYGLLDVLAGSLTTLLAALLTARCRRRWLAPLPPVVLNALIIGALLSYEQAGTGHAFRAVFCYNAASVAIGEALSCYGLGLPLLRQIEKRGISDIAHQ